jgi:hypothetical protein
MLNPSVNTFQTRQTSSNRNRRLEIRLLRNPITTRRRRQMETNRLPIKDNGTRRMQLRCSRQRTISHSSSLKEWRRYLKGSRQQFKVLTDHKNLVPFTTTKVLSDRQIRWSETLNGFDFKIEYRPGKEGGKPDALTRRQEDMPKEGDERLTQKERILLPKEQYFSNSIQEMEVVELKDQQEEEIQQATTKDDQLQTIRQALEKGEKEMKGIPLGLCQWKEGYLWYQNKIWIPDNEPLRSAIIRKQHDVPQAGHGGTAKTTELIQRRYYWPKMRETIKRYVKNCDTCQRIKVVRHAPYGLLQSNEIPMKPWQSIAMDFITDLPGSEGNDSILVVIDRLTKMSHFIPCKKELTAEGLARIMTKEIFRLHGIPKDIITDRGTLFTSDFWKNYMTKMGVDRRLSTAFHPQTDGQTERTNSILEQYLRAYVNYQQDNWNELLPISRIRLQ